MLGFLWMKVFIFVCGEGLDHTSRCLAIGREMLSAGHKVCFGAYGYSKEFIEKYGYQTYEVPAETQLVGSSGSLDMKRSIVSTLRKGQILGIFKMLKLISRTKTDAVISGSYYLGILAARIKRYPIYLMVNQSNMDEFFTDGGPVLRLLGTLVRRFYRSVFRLVDGIIVPDFPLPHTICRMNLDFEPQVAEKIFFSGSLVGKRYNEIEAMELDRPHVLPRIGGFGYREPIFRKIIETAKLD